MDTGVSGLASVQGVTRRRGVIYPQALTQREELAWAALHPAHETVARLVMHVTQ
jgi:hypothetical protein